MPTQPQRRESGTATLAPVVRLHQHRAVALAGDYLAAVESAAGRRAAIGAATDTFLAALTAQRADPAPVSAHAEPSATSEDRTTPGGDVLEAWVARACLLALVPVAVGLRVLVRPGWGIEAPGTVTGVGGIAVALVLTVVGSVWTWRVTAPLCRRPGHRAAPRRRDGGVAVVTLLPFLTCLLPAAVLAIVA
jgi:hypothetical protein